jgi:hypothetical protein
MMVLRGKWDEGVKICCHLGSVKKKVSYPAHLRHFVFGFGAQCNRHQSGQAPAAVAFR